MSLTIILLVMLLLLASGVVGYLLGYNQYRLLQLIKQVEYRTKQPAQEVTEPDSVVIDPDDIDEAERRRYSERIKRLNNR